MTAPRTLDARFTRYVERARAARPAGNGGLPGLAATGLRTTTEGTGRAASVARVLGGRVEDSAAGPVVVVDDVVRLPLDASPLARLPDPVAPGARLVCIDTETTGLGTAAGTLPFLVGLGWWEGADLRLRQLVLPDHADERAFLAALTAAIPEDAWLVTYNGRSFDWPLIESRYRLHGGDAPSHAGHLDLLLVARLLWRHRLPDARLASVEAGIAGVRRGVDLPGALIPERYFGYLRTGKAHLLRAIAEHNLQDIVSLGRLLDRLTHQLAATGPSGHPGDLAALGRAYASRRRHAEALAAFDAALGMLSRVDARFVDPRLRDLRLRVSVDRARVLARLGRREEAHQCWLELARSGGSDAAPAWIQIAKHHEHVRRDLDGALDAAQRADGLTRRARWLGRPMPEAERDLALRLARLRRRLAAASVSRSRVPAAPPPGTRPAGPPLPGAGARIVV